MRRILIILFFVLFGIIGGILISPSPRQDTNNLLNSFSIETSRNVPYVRYNTLVLNNITLDFDVILDENNIDATFHEVYVIQKDVVFFGYSTTQENQNSGKIWNIATIKLDGTAFNPIYSAEFCLEKDADPAYNSNHNTSVNNRYSTANGFYHDNKIVLTDHVKLIEFDLKTGNVAEFIAADYTYPSAPDVEIVDHQTIVFTENSSKLTFDAERGRQTSLAFAKLLELGKKKTWNGEPLLSDLFDKVQIVDDQIFILCRVMNWHGETHAVAFLFNLKTNSCQYAFHCFMDDLIMNNLYIVPIRGQ